MRVILDEYEIAVVIAALRFLISQCEARLNLDSNVARFALTYTRDELKRVLPKFDRQEPQE